MLALFSLKTTKDKLEQKWVAFYLFFYFILLLKHNNFILISRIKGADCIFVSWNTRVSKKVIEESKYLKYIGKCCGLYDEKSSNVDIEIERKNNIEVRSIRDYGDNIL